MVVLVGQFVTHSEHTHCRERLTGKPSNQNVMGWNLAVDIDGPDITSNVIVWKVLSVQRYTARCHLRREDTLATEGLQAQGEPLGGRRWSVHANNRSASMQHATWLFRDNIQQTKCRF